MGGNLMEKFGGKEIVLQKECVYTGYIKFCFSFRKTLYNFVNLELLIVILIVVGNIVCL